MWVARDTGSAGRGRRVGHRTCRSTNAGRRGIDHHRAEPACGAGGRSHGCCRGCGRADDQSHPGGGDFGCCEGRGPRSSCAPRGHRRPGLSPPERRASLPPWLERRRGLGLEDVDHPFALRFRADDISPLGRLHRRWRNYKGYHATFDRSDGQHRLRGCSNSWGRRRPRPAGCAHDSGSTAASGRQRAQVGVPALTTAEWRPLPPLAPPGTSRFRSHRSSSRRGRRRHPERRRSPFERSCRWVCRSVCSASPLSLVLGRIGVWDLFGEETAERELRARYG